MFLYILWNNKYLIENYWLLTKNIFILIRYIILPIQAFFLYYIFNKKTKENIIISTSILVILRIILEYSLEPMIYVNKIIYFIIKENISKYQPFVSYITALVFISAIYIIARKSINYLIKIWFKNTPPVIPEEKYMQ